jgi:hypothetical protein
MLTLSLEPSAVCVDCIEMCVESMHVPAFWHGDDLHSFTSTPQL